MDKRGRQKVNGLNEPCATAKSKLSEMISEMIGVAQSGRGTKDGRDRQNGRDAKARKSAIRCQQESGSPALSRRRKTALRDAAASKQLGLFTSQNEHLPSDHPQSTHPRSQRPQHLSTTETAASLGGAQNTQPNSPSNTVPNAVPNTAPNTDQSADPNAAPSTAPNGPLNSYLDRGLNRTLDRDRNKAPSESNTDPSWPALNTPSTPRPRTVLDRPVLSSFAPLPTPRAPRVVLAKRAEPPKVTVSAPECSPGLAQALAESLQEFMSHTLHLVVHDNRSTMVSFRRSEKQMTLRVHHMFVDAQPQVVKALADYSRSRCKEAGALLDHHVRSNRELIRKPSVENSRRRNTQGQGQHHDLQLIYDQLNARYFQGSIDAHIGWGRGSSKGRRRSIRMGAYYHQDRSILIHPALDQARVPRFFVEFVVYHEMLHQAVPQERSPSGRRCVHPPEFRRRERLFHAYERAQEWERENLELLLGTKTRRPGPL